MATVNDWDVLQLDINTAFLNGDLEEEVLMKQPDAFPKVLDKKGFEMVCHLLKSLYGLKQAPRQWKKKLDQKMFKRGFRSCAADLAIYYKTTNGKFVFVGFYVDDGIILAQSREDSLQVVKDLQEDFDLDYQGDFNGALGFEWIRNRKNRPSMLLQSTYIKDLLERFQMEESYPNGFWCLLYS